MTRPLRVLAENASYHIISRGNARMDVFRSDDERRRFLDLLADVVAQFRVACHAFCLMANHYHLVGQTAEPNLSDAIRQLNGTYAQWWNRRQDRIGHVWQGRFKAQLLQRDGHFLEACRYVVLNPIRAGLVTEPGDWPWSSYRATVGIAPCPSFLTTHVVLGARRNAQACEAYRTFIAAGHPDSSTTASIRGDVPVIGSEEFVTRFDEQLERGHPTEVPKRDRLLGRPSLEACFAGTSTRADRNQRMERARRRHGYTVSEIARFLGLHYSTVSVIVAKTPKSNI
jgi:REP element-mobilizing transposase RayT